MSRSRAANTASTDPSLYQCIPRCHYTETMPRPRERRTYLLRQLPQHLERKDVPAFLCKASPDFGLEEGIEIFSLAENLIT
jgi:hypothetical protein